MDGEKKAGGKSVSSERRERTAKNLVDTVSTAVTAREPPPELGSGDGERPPTSGRRRGSDGKSHNIEKWRGRRGEEVKERTVKFVRWGGGTSVDDNGG